MHKRWIAICLAAALLSACSMQPRLAMPDGRNRLPINSQGAIDEYTVMAAQESAAASEEAQQRQLAAVKRDLAQLKVLMAELSLNEGELPPRAKNRLPGRATTGTPGPTVATANTAVYRPSETVSVRDRSILFRIALGIGKTEFAPSSAFRQAVLAAAKNAARIDIWGSPDTTKATPESTRIALARAENARKYMLDNGIAPGRISAPSLGAGGSLAANPVPAGKARNGRVEIEIELLAPSTIALEAQDRQAKGATQ